MPGSDTGLVNLGEILRLPASADSIAYVDLRDPQQPRSYTARELDDLIAAAARGLLRRGINPGDRVGILAENRVEFIASYFGIMRTGAVAVPINHKLPVKTIHHIFNDSEIRLALCDAPRLAYVPAGVDTIGFDARDERGWEALLDPGPFASFVPTQDHIAEILYTSGSTGVPKGVPLTHHGQLWAISLYLDPIESQQPAPTTLVVAPLYHMNGLFFSTIALANRMTIVSMPRFDARRYLESVAQYRCAILSGVPTMFALMVREYVGMSPLDLSCVSSVMLGSAPVTDALLDRVQRLFPNARIENGFGTTEAGPAVFGPHPDGLPKPPLSLGYPIAGIGCRLVDGPSADEGVLTLRTPALMGGYLNLPHVTAQKMRDGWYVTGDLMRRDAQGFFHFIGRADDMFVCGGENIYPGEVEKLLERHPAVAQAVVVAAPDDIKGHIPVAFVVPRGQPWPEPQEIQRYALANGPAYAHPRFIELRAALPVSGTHKIDRAALTAEAAGLSRAAGRTG